MTPEHAHNLAVRYHNIWRGGPPVAELEAQLLEHDFDTACAVISQLARGYDNPPTIRQLHAEIRGTTTTALPRPLDTGPVIDPADYWHRIEQRANDGDHDAITQLDNYRRTKRHDRTMR